MLSARFDIWVLAPHAPGSQTQETLGNLTVVRFRYFFDWGESLAYQGGIMAKLRSNRLRYLLVPLFLGSQWLALVRMLMSQHFDVIHAHWLFPQGFVAAMAKSLTPRFPALVCTSHGTDLNGLRGALFAKIKRYAMRQSNALTVVSSSMLQSAQSLGADMRKTCVIPMGVDAQVLFTPDGSVVRSARELLFVGRLDSQKGVDVLVRAMPGILLNYPDCRLNIIGQGPERQNLQDQVDRLALSTHVEFLGALPNAELSRYYRSATLLVFPSTGAEGLGLVCAEALACECPVVASDLPAVRELVQSEVSGLFFQQGNCAELTQKVLGLLSDPARRGTMGAEGRKHVLAHFDWSRVVDDFSALFDRVHGSD